MTATPSLTMTPDQAVEYSYICPKTPDQLWWYIRILFNVRVPRTKVCEDCDAPFDVVREIFFNKVPEIVLVGARGTAKSVTLAVVASVIILAKRVDVSIIAGSKDQSELVVKYLNNEDSSLAGQLWGSDLAPRARLDERTESKRLVRTLGTTKQPGNQIYAHAASEANIRGHHPTVVLYDECDVAEHKHIEDSRGLPMENANNPDVPICTVFASTYHKYDGTMSKLLKEFKEKERTRRQKLIFSWCWREQQKANGGFLSQRYIRDKRASTSDAQWEAEYENKGPQGGLRVFDKVQLEYMFQKRLGNILGKEDEEPYIYNDHPGLARHYHGCDWARDEHWTVLDTLQKVKVGYQRVGWYRTGRRSYAGEDGICRTVANHVKKFKGPICHDATGVGKALDDILVDQERLNRKSVEGIDWTQKKLIQQAAGYYQYAVENEEICGPYIAWAFSEHEYLTVDMLTPGTGVHCPDSVAAGIMANYMARLRHGSGARTSIICRVR